MYLEEIGHGLDSSSRLQAGFPEQGNVPSGFMKGGEFPD
jgi:hypothetical protein